MLKRNYLIPILLLIITLFSGCELVVDIFEAGVAFGVIISAAVFILLVWGIKLIKKKFNG